MTDAVMNARELRRDLARLDSLAAPATISQWREQQFWMDNLIQNGGMDSDTAWTKGTGWSIGSGVASASSASSYLSATVAPLKPNSHFLIGYTVSNYTAGNIRAQIGTFIDASEVGADRLGNGSFSEHLQTLGDSGFRIQGYSSASADIDNVFAFESDGANVIHRLPEGWTPHNVYVDGLLQREGTAHDYTVETDGFDKWIKPAVAPGALTETCIMGVRKV